MRYGEIARKIRQETKALSETASRLNALADELERIDSATPAVKPVQDIGQGKMLLTVREAAETLGLSRATVYTLIHRDDFPSIRIGSKLLINTKKLQEWVDNQIDISKRPTI